MGSPARRWVTEAEPTAIDGNNVISLKTDAQPLFQTDHMDSNLRAMTNEGPASPSVTTVAAGCLAATG